MTGIGRKITSSAATGLMNHISKLEHNDKYAAKAVLFTSVGLNLYSNMVDFYRIKKNKEIESEEKKYLQAFSLTNGFVSAATQLASGLAIVSDKVQGKIIKSINWFDKGFSERLAKSSGKNLLKRNLLKVSSLIGAIAITKRILTPLIVTPLASMFDDKINKIKIEDKDNDDRFKRHENEEKNIFKRHMPNLYRKERYDDDDDRKDWHEYKFEKNYAPLEDKQENIFIKYNKKLNLDD